MVTTVRYHFRQSFPVPPKEAFDWCTDYNPQDLLLIGCSGSTRAVTRVSESSILLTDTFRTKDGFVEKQKLVQLYPDQLFWVATHLTGLNKHSQFLYQISPDQKGGSYLDFTALHLEYESKEDAKILAARYCKADSSMWKLLAKAMTDNLQKSKSREKCLFDRPFGKLRLTRFRAVARPVQSSEYLVSFPAPALCPVSVRRKLLIGHQLRQLGNRGVGLVGLLRRKRRPLLEPPRLL